VAAARRSNGEGSFSQRRDGRWQGSTRVVDPVSGQSRRVFAYGATRAEAKKRLDAKLGRVRDGAPVTDSRDTLAAWVTLWTQTSLEAASLAPKTKELRGYLLRVHVASDPIGLMRLADIRVSHITAWLVRLEKGDTSTGRQLSQATRRHCLYTLRSALDGAVDEGLIASNVALKVRSIALPKPQVTAPEANAVGEMLELVRDHRYYPG
jgi:integrase